MSHAIKLVEDGIKNATGGEIIVPKLKSFRVKDLIEAITKKKNYFYIVGIRPGEKLHEQMISSEDSRYTYEYQKYYKILPQINKWSEDPKRIKDGRKVPLNFVYSSESNDDWMSVAELRAWICNNQIY